VRRKLPAPSPAMAVAITALIVALGGTVYAASGINGRTIKKNSIPGNRLKKNSVTGAQVNEASLAQVPSAASAANAGRATSAGKADSAANAASADTATNAKQLGGHAAAQFGSGLMTGQITGLSTGSQVGAPTGLSVATGSETVVAGLWPEEALTFSDLTVSLRGGENMPGGTSRTVSVVDGFQTVLSCTIHEAENGCTDPGPFAAKAEPSINAFAAVATNETGGAVGTQFLLFTYRVSP
jgi:hypothetical protein